MKNMVSHHRKLTPRNVSLETEPENVAQQLSHLPGFMYFDTSGNIPSHASPPLSIITANPTQIIKGYKEDFSEVAHLLEKHQSHSGPDLGFPTGGVCGWVDYEGAFVFGVYPEMLIYHHQTEEWWEIGTLSEKRQTPSLAQPLQLGKWQSSLEKEDFLEAVKRAQEYIRAGDIYQVNLSRHLNAPCTAPSGLFSLYQKLRTAAPSPLATYINLAGREILSSSPETFLKISGREIETRPIKGTRPRFANPELDSRSAFDLQRSEKETAELIMITDLLRNDLGKISDFGTVRVTEMLQLEKLQHVHHLASTIRGTLKADISQLDALNSCLPGGSITGAPKKRAMEIIAELEPSARGLYTGTMGYLGFNGESQFNIAIRTLIHDL